MKTSVLIVCLRENYNCLKSISTTRELTEREFKEFKLLNSLLITLEEVRE